VDVPGLCEGRERGLNQWAGKMSLQQFGAHGFERLVKLDLGDLA
jgi:hypothetical protein